MLPLPRWVKSTRGIWVEAPYLCLNLNNQKSLSKALRNFSCNPSEGVSRQCWVRDSVASYFVGAVPLLSNCTKVVTIPVSAVNFCNSNSLWCFSHCDFLWYLSCLSNHHHCLKKSWRSRDKTKQKKLMKYKVYIKKVR
jgi:hypothetical protein